MFKKEIRLLVPQGIRMSLEEIIIAQIPLQEVVIQNPAEVPVWNEQDQEILEWLFPSLREPPRPVTPDCPEPPRLQRGLRRTRALSRREWADLLSVV